MPQPLDSKPQTQIKATAAPYPNALGVWGGGVASSVMDPPSTHSNDKCTSGGGHLAIQSCGQVSSVEELIDKLKNEAKVL